VKATDSLELSPKGLTCALSHILKGVHMTTKILAKFIFHDVHTVTLIQTPDGRGAKCDTCSISLAVDAAVKLMYGHNVWKMTIDGAPLNRI
jgi:hypothetical protein